MTKLLLVALCSLPLLSAARAEEGQMKADTMQHGDMNQGDGMGHEKTKTTQKSKKAKKKDAGTTGQGESMKPGDSMKQDDKMDQGMK